MQVQPAFPSHRSAARETQAPQIMIFKPITRASPFRKSYHMSRIVAMKQIPALRQSAVCKQQSSSYPKGLTRIRTQLGRISVCVHAKSIQATRPDPLIGANETVHTMLHPSDCQTVSTQAFAGSFARWPPRLKSA